MVDSSHTSWKEVFSKLDTASDSYSDLCRSCVLEIGLIDALLSMGIDAYGDVDLRERKHTLLKEHTHDHDYY